MTTTSVTTSAGSTPRLPHRRRAQRRHAGVVLGAAALLLGSITAASTATASTGNTSNGVILTSPDRRVSADPTTSATTTAFVPVGPARLADTRADVGITRIDDTTVRVQITGREGIDDDALAAMLTVTAVGAAAEGYVTVWPAGTRRPNASNLNLRAGETRANGAIVRLGSEGAIDLHTSVPVDLIVDATGVFMPSGPTTAGRFTPSGPTRRLDTRGLERPEAGASIDLNADQLGVPAGASAVAINVTSVEADTAGFVTAWPAGTERPTTSVVNTDAPGQTRAAFATVPLGPDGISIYSSVGAHLLVDVIGWFTGPGAAASEIGLFVPQDPTRMVDTRIDAWPLTAGVLTRLDGPLPGALAMVANWTSVDAAGASFLSAIPDEGGPSRSTAPNISTVNSSGGAVANLAITTVGSFGIGVWSFAGEHLLVDVAGWFTGSGGTASLAPAPPADPLPGALPVPERVSRPSTAPMTSTPLRLEPALSVGSLTAMVWNVLEDAYYAITQEGSVRRIPRDLSTAEVVLDLTTEVPPIRPFSEQGLLGLAFDPVDGRMFLHLTDRAGDSQLVSFAMVGGRPDPASRRQVLTVAQPGPGHQGGALRFDAVGNLYAAFGDGGGSSGRDAQDDTNLHGTIIRITPSRDGDGYTVPADNPTVGDASRRDEIWVNGLRNPWQFTIDPATDDVWVADVGERDREEINVVPAGSSGQNFGWYWFEGTRDRGFASVPAGVQFTSPVFEYGRTDGVAVIGGVVYHGTAIPTLRGAYVFADMSGPFFAVGREGGVRLPLRGTGPITGFVETPDRELLVLTLRNGIFRLLPG